MKTDVLSSFERTLSGKPTGIELLLSVSICESLNRLESVGELQDRNISNSPLDLPVLQEADHQCRYDHKCSDTRNGDESSSVLGCVDLLPYDER